MRYKLISCEVFARLAYLAAANSKHIIDMEFTKLRSHVNPDGLRAELQGMIDSSAEQYDALLLCFGLCGNSTAGLEARNIPMVIPRAHDCCTVFLGSKAAFHEHFGNTPSAQWCTACYYERYGSWYADNALGMLTPDQSGDYAELVEKYGEENAQYIWESLSIKTDIDFLTYIEIPGITDSEIKEEFAKHAAEAGKKLRLVKGSSRLIEKLTAGDWNDDEFLIVPAGSKINPIYDHDKVFDI